MWCGLIRFMAQNLIQTQLDMHIRSQMESVEETFFQGAWTTSTVSFSLKWAAPLLHTPTGFLNCLNAVFCNICEGLNIVWLDNWEVYLLAQLSLGTSILIKIHKQRKRTACWLSHYYPALILCEHVSNYCTSCSLRLHSLSWFWEYRLLLWSSSTPGCHLVYCRQKRKWRGSDLTASK